MRQQLSTRRHTRIQADTTTHTERSIQSMHTNDNTNFNPSGNRRHRRHGAAATSAATPTIVIRLTGARHNQGQRLVITLGNQGPRNQGQSKFNCEFRADGPHRHGRDEQSDGFHAGGLGRHGQNEFNREFRGEDSRGQTVPAGFSPDQSRHGRREFAPEFHGESPRLHRERPSIEGFQAEGPRRHRGGGGGRCTCSSHAERPQRHGQMNRERGMRRESNRSGDRRSMNRDQGQRSMRRDW